MKTAYSSAATLVGKRVEEIRESVQQPGTPQPLSPAGSYQYLSTPDGGARGGRPDDDALSNCSGGGGGGGGGAGESRRPSAIDQASSLWGGGGGGADQDTWSSLTGALWDQFWGTGEYAPARNSGPRPSRIMDAEPFESLYSKMPKRLPGKHEIL